MAWGAGARPARPPAGPFFSQMHREKLPAVIRSGSGVAAAPAGPFSALDEALQPPESWGSGLT